MKIQELAAAYPQRPNQSVPAWTIGCFRRRSITYYTGQMDTATEVWWLQSYGLTADLRLWPDQPALKEKPYPNGCTPDELTALAQVEGGIAETRWNGSQMSWDNWTAFQLHDKWPEPGKLYRVGDCLIEFAPSGAYVEDWRRQPASEGLLVGLRLIDERNSETDELLYRGGGLIICGDHAALIRGRKQPIETDQKLADFLSAHLENQTKISEIFNFETSYGRRSSVDHPYLVESSTHPLRQGNLLFDQSGFEFDLNTGKVFQRFEEEGIPRIRTFEIDTLEASFEGSFQTPVSPSGERWLRQEAETLLRFQTGHRPASSS